jgi:hypothetical protein
MNIISYAVFGYAGLLMGGTVLVLAYYAGNDFLRRCERDGIRLVWAWPPVSRRSSIWRSLTVSEKQSLPMVVSRISCRGLEIDSESPDARGSVSGSNQIITVQADHDTSSAANDLIYKNADARPRRLRKRAF